MGTIFNQGVAFESVPAGEKIAIFSRSAVLLSKKGKPTKKMPPPFVKGGKPGKGGKKC